MPHAAWGPAATSDLRPTHLGTKESLEKGNPFLSAFFFYSITVTKPDLNSSPNIRRNRIKINGNIIFLAAYCLLKRGDCSLSLAPAQILLRCRYHTEVVVTLNTSCHHWFTTARMWTEVTNRTTHFPQHVTNLEDIISFLLSGEGFYHGYIFYYISCFIFLSYQNAYFPNSVTGRVKLSFRINLRVDVFSVQMCAFSASDIWKFSWWVYNVTLSWRPPDCRCKVGVLPCVRAVPYTLWINTCWICSSWLIVESHITEHLKRGGC